MAVCFTYGTWDEEAKPFVHQTNLVLRQMPAETVAGRLEVLRKTGEAAHVEVRQLSGEDQVEDLMKVERT